MALGVNPNLKMVPDFASNLYAGIQEEARVLAEVERAQTVQENEECTQWEAEAEREWLEAERKKLKMNSFEHASSVGDYLTPLPTQYAIQKLTNFEFVELWYFSPEGCKDALKSSRSLSFSIFLRAKNLFLIQISKAKWPQPNIDALSMFFWHLKNHLIRNHSDIRDMVILTYASRICQDWHNHLKRDEGFNIGNINENLI
ncbi:hypothetical protein CY34DRAFT_23364 [Suillus luteus UH-Slu-Lm8-n1]|uniref:Uncharacterized protein n=1 Tax=Suillus luteus UH-Slu-Lm8-n1 TaxID=930992 RepID=A0A0D0A1N6_9AGAM|nr:hypothetical protein CY34DRAFT_23364 [Suillus luteus UH-Slu-Lm8-n1]